MMRRLPFFVLFFFNDTATTEIYTLSLHDALPIFAEPSATEHDFQELDPVRADDGDAITRLDTGRAQGTGTTRRGLVRVGIGPRRPSRRDQGLLRKSFGLARQHRRQRAIGGRERLRPLRSQL